MKFTRAVLILLVAAGLGMAVFGIMVRRAVTVENAAPSEALKRFEDLRATFGSAQPLITLDAEGRPVGLSATPEGFVTKPQRLHVLVYRVREEQLVWAEMPFWFFKLKGPAAQLALRGTDFDLKRLELTASDLEGMGPRLIWDETRAGGDRVLIWTE